MDGTILGQGLIGADGTWTVPLNPPAATGDMLAITAIDAAGNTSPITTLRVGIMYVAADKHAVRRSGPIRFAVVNLQPGELVAGVVMSDPIPLGSTVAGIDGIAVFDWTVPADFPLGVHTFQAIGEFSGPMIGAEFAVAEAEVAPSSSDGAGSGSSKSSRDTKASPSPRTGKATTGAKSTAAPANRAGTGGAGGGASTALAGTGVNTALAILCTWSAAALAAGALATALSRRRRIRHSQPT
jgi:hypothetical protein